MEPAEAKLNDDGCALAEPKTFDVVLEVPKGLVLDAAAPKIAPPPKVALVVVAEEPNKLVVTDVTVTDGDPNTEAG